MKQFLRDYFSFNRRERNGVVVLLCILMFLLGFQAYQHLYGDRVPALDDFREEVIAVPEPTQNQSSAPELPRTSTERTIWKEEGKEKRTPSYVPFNPNTITEAVWMSLGLTSRQAQIIGNYLNKGGRFRKAEDLRKIYSLSPEQEAALEPWVRIPPDTTGQKAARLPLIPDKLPPVSSVKMKQGEKLELNTADSTALLRLPGIGPAFAKRILAYRNRLGGFASSAQLMEVFGMDEERFQGIQGFLTVDISGLRKIPVNTATAEEMRKHPYIPWKLANLLVNYRKLHGAFQKTEDLGKLELMTPVLLEKLSPYISLN